jgi:hypothetical protein
VTISKGLRGPKERSCQLKTTTIYRKIVNYLTKKNLQMFKAVGNNRNEINIEEINNKINKRVSPIFLSI